MAAQEEAEVKNADSRKSESETPRNPHHQARVGTRTSSGSSPMWDRKVSTEASHGAAPLTPGRSRLRQVTRGDETPDDSTAVPVFGDWDDNDPASADGYSGIFNKVREEKHGGGGKSPRVTSDNSYFYGQRPESKKGCGCFPWGKK